MDKKIIIRPSSLDSFLGCPWQWYNVFILGKKTIPNARATIGTAIHKGAEVMWNDAINSGTKDLNKTKLYDAAIEEYQKEEKEAEDGLNYKDGEDSNTAQLEVVRGVEAFVEDIAPFVDIPDAVETRYTMKLDHPVVEAISGTVDYDHATDLGDIKTSGRKINAPSYELQQGTYKLLREHNGKPVKRNVIHGIILPKKKENIAGQIDVLEPNTEKVKVIINNMLDTLETYSKDIAPPEVLFRGNPKHYLCSNTYCSLHPTCKFAQGEIV